MSNVDAKLDDWADIAHHFEEDQPREGKNWKIGGGILIGNGASINAYNEFGYNSLYEMADLKADDKALFEEFDTTNFERVLAHLKIAIRVNQLAEYPVEELKARYESIKTGLVEAVNAVHPKRYAFPEAMFTRTQAALLRYKWVFSTNYDLLVYWSFVKKFDRFLDYLWSKGDAGARAFNPKKVKVHKPNRYRTRVLWLHGALHLYQSCSGLDCKLTNKSKDSILDQFVLLKDRGEVPLFVAEGTADDKMSVINTSRYLSFALKKLRQFGGPLVVFGSELQESDDHLIEAIKDESRLRRSDSEKRQYCWDGRKLAFAVYPDQRGATIASYKTRVIEALECDECDDVYFFDSTSHPLGAPDIAMSPEAAPEHLPTPTPTRQSAPTDSSEDRPVCDGVSSEIDG